MANRYQTCTVICLLMHITGAVYSPATETSIRSFIFPTSYDKYARPEAQTTINAAINLLAIDELDLKGQRLTSVGWFTFDLKTQRLVSAGWFSIAWTDSRLVWTPSSYGDIEYIFVDHSVIWTPELVVDNSLDSIGVLEAKNLLLKVNHDGSVEWEPPLLFTTHCQVDITYYPYDYQKCSIKLVSWGYTFDDIKLEHSRTDVNLEDFEVHGEWNVFKTEMEISNITETKATHVDIYPVLHFWIYMERRTDFYNLNVMMPIILTSLLVALVFIVPVDSGEKLSFILTILLTLAVLLTITAESLPSTSISTSVLGVYLGLVLLLAAVAVLLTVVIIIFHHTEGGLKRNSCSAKLARFSAKITCTKLPGLTKVEESKVNSIQPDQKSMSSFEMNDELEVTWPEVASVIDKACFMVFLIATVLANVSVVVALTAGASEHDL